MKPTIILNFKNYREGIENATKIVSSLSVVKGWEVVVCPSLLSLANVKRESRVAVFAQHADNVEWGAHTGHVSPAELRFLGVQGALLNHSERKLPWQILAETVSLCQKYRLMTVVCASSLAEVQKFCLLKPTMIAYEPKELIGGNTSVTALRPGLIRQAVQIVKHLSPKTNVICGAGIHSRKDVQEALRLGCKGFLVSHAFITAKNPHLFLKELTA